MWLVLLFRICLFIGFLYAVWKWGNWKNWEKYYPTALFMMVVNLSANFLTYNHPFWNYSPDVLVNTQTTLELISCFVILPSTAFIYLSQFPSNSKINEYGYIVLWVLIYSGLEFMDHYLIKGIYYTNGWSWLSSTIFDFAIFSILRLHYLRPFWAWIVTILLAAAILMAFNFDPAKMK